MHGTILRALLALAGAGTIASAAAVDITQFIRTDAFNNLKLSPQGDYYAATVPMEETTVVVVMRTADGSLAGHFRAPEDNHAASFDWVSDERLLIGLAQSHGQLDEPRLTGELFAMDADGKRSELLVGYRVQGRGPGTRIQPKKVEYVAAFLTDDLPAEERNVLVTIWPGSEDPYTRLDRLDVVSGQRSTVARSPVRRAAFTTDNAGRPRFARGAGSDNVNKLYYRDASNDQWRLVHDEALDERQEIALGFSADDSIAYLQVEMPRGPDAIISWNPATGERRELLRDELVEPSRILRRPGTAIPVGALYLGDKPRTRFFDEQSDDARLYRSLEAAFGGDALVIGSSTRDGNKVLVETFSGRNPGDFFVYDRTAKHATHVASRSQWIDPAKAAEVRPISIKARDGMALHGFLTLPTSAETRNLPTVVLPHGGPFGVFDDGRYDSEAQMLAAAGYAVVQLNFRGSGNYGWAYRAAGAREWGGRMQDDVTDVTRWAISEGIADRNRICIYGASYGGYAALMGVAKEQGLYRCAAGYVGVYDLPLMHTRGDIQDRASGVTYLRDWMGDPKTLEDVSPVNLAGQIKVPVFLAAGREDQRAPVQHTERMEAALTRAGVPVQSLYYPREGHGFYKDANRREYYTQLLDFFATHIGGAKATKKGTEEVN